MTGLTLKSNSGRTNKTKNNSIAVVAVDFPGEFRDRYISKHASYVQFFASSKADDQLAPLKVILDQNKESPDDDIIKFLVIVFLQAPVKHPVKCFLARHITKTFGLQHPFSTSLSSEICSIIAHNTNDYKDYNTVVTKLGACIESFPTGVEALKLCEVEAAQYLRDCLNCCVATLRHIEPLSPTEKHEVFILSHSSLRLLLHIIQKVSSHNIEDVTSNFLDISANIQYLLGDDETPMDTKSVCGILLLTMYVLENGENSWVRILHSSPPEDYLTSILSSDAAHLSLYSAIITVVPVDRLQSELVDGEPAVVVLTERILGIGDRGSSDGAFTLTVARTVLLLARSLLDMTDRRAGQRIVDLMLVFIWSHLEHHMDSVRHLSAHALGCVVRYSGQLDKEGDDKALTALFSALTSLDPTRKSYFLCISALTQELGAGVMLARVQGLVCRLLEALASQQVQACATTALDTLLDKHVRQSNTAATYSQWIQPIIDHVATTQLDSGVLGALENLLTKVVKLDDGVMEFVLPYIKQGSGGNLKCILLLLSVARRSGALAHLEGGGDSQWRGVIEYDVLKTAAVDSVDETRILALSLIVDSAKSTEKFTAGDFDFMLHYLKYNINTQSPNYRQLTLSYMKKFINRLSDSYKVLKRLNKPNGRVNESHYYLEFIEKLRQQCFDSLIQGANYSRRFVALQTLSWCEHLDLDGYSPLWKEEYVDKMLLHLEDSYENNKEYALQILDKCPTELLESRSYSTSLVMEDILRQASSVRPTECPSAAYKLRLLVKKMPHKVLDEAHRSIPSAPTYSVLSLLLQVAQTQLSLARASILAAAARAPMYGVLHCAKRLLQDVDASAISTSPAWRSLVSELVALCFSVSEVAAPVVNSSSPEGHLPMDKLPATGQGVPDGVSLGDNSQVTAQMVLLCAWRSVKEESLLLGCLSSRLTIASESPGPGGTPGPPGTLTADQLMKVGQHLSTLLAQTKHRGAFEQAHVGFTLLVTRLWRCRCPALSSLPARWLASLMRDIEGGEGALCATRRSAGVPFMIQALVTTELQVNGNASCFHSCITALLRMAQFDAHVTYTPAQVSARTHALNILRALFRNTSLAECAAVHVAAGLLAAVRGFDARTWSERNSATLLFSALTVRVFGVPRSRDSERLCARNTMTGRVFFLRYPRLYDHMLARLKEVSQSDDPRPLRPSLYPILLLLARLYPSALEGSVSNLKLVAFIPHVLSCASSCVLKTRQLAAKAMVPLISPEQYLPHIAEMFSLLSNNSIQRNFCHGILLQLVRLLDAAPTTLTWSARLTDSLVRAFNRTLWVLEQAAGRVPCYLLADEYVKTVNLILWRFPPLISEETLRHIQITLDRIIFRNDTSIVISGREVCLANSLYLHLVIQSRTNSEHIPELVMKGLLHDTYEVVLATLNYLLILNSQIDEENLCKLLQHLSETPDKENILKQVRGEAYLETLCCVLKTKKLQECVQKTLKVLSLENDTQRIMVGGANTISDEEVVTKLLKCLETDRENLKHIYLYSLLNFITVTSATLSKSQILDVMRVVYSFCSSENSDTVRQTVVEFLRDNCRELMDLSVEGLSDGEQFEYKTTILTIIVHLLEDDNVSIRQVASDTVVKQQQIQQQNNHTTTLLPTKAADHAIRQIASDIVVQQQEIQQQEQQNDRTTTLLPTKAADHAIRQIASDIVVEQQEIQQQEQQNDRTTTLLPTKAADHAIRQIASDIVVQQQEIQQQEQQNDRTTTLLPTKAADHAIRQIASDIVVQQQEIQQQEQQNDRTTTLLPTKAADHAIRQIASDIVVQQQEIQQQEQQNDRTTTLLPTKAAEILRDYIERRYDGQERLAMFVVIALLDFRSEVMITDDSNEECRVFDQNERYNIFLEETVWTKECAEKIKIICKNTSTNILLSVQNVIQNSLYRETIVRLCNNNFRIFEELILSKNTAGTNNDIINPKIGIFISELGI